ncbi:MAG: hypothetical protein ABI373_08125, partial [Flavobacteriales bacterium]
MIPKTALLAIATLILFSCSSAPMAPETSTAPATTTVATKDTVIDRYERKEVKEIKRDTTKVAQPQ